MGILYWIIETTLNQHFLISLYIFRVKVSVKQFLCLLDNFGFFNFINIWFLHGIRKPLAQKTMAMIQL